MNLLVKAKHITKGLLSRQPCQLSTKLNEIHSDIEKFKKDSKAITILIDVLSHSMKEGYVNPEDANTASNFLLRTAQRKSKEFDAVENRVNKLKHRKKK